MKLTPDDLRDLAEELAQLVHLHHDVLDTEPRIARPLKEALNAAKIRYEAVTESPVERRNEPDAIRPRTGCAHWVAMNKPRGGGEWPKCEKCNRPVMQFD